MDYSGRDEFINKYADRQSFIVFASTEWCNNCRFIDAMFVANNIDTSKIIKIDPEKTKLTRELSVDNVPSFVKIINGEIVEVTWGLMGASELKEMIKSLSPPEKEKVNLDTGEPLDVIEEE